MARSGNGDRRSVLWDVVVGLSVLSVVAVSGFGLGTAVHGGSGYPREVVVFAAEPPPRPGGTAVPTATMFVPIPTRGPVIYPGCHAVRLHWNGERIVCNDKRRLRPGDAYAPGFS